MSSTNDTTKWMTVVTVHTTVAMFIDLTLPVIPYNTRFILYKMFEGLFSQPIFLLYKLIQ